MGCMAVKLLCRFLDVLFLAKQVKIENILGIKEKKKQPLFQMVSIDGGWYSAKHMV